MQVTQEQFLRSVARIVIYGHDYAHDLLEEEKKEQEIDYPYIRLWCQNFNITENAIRVRLARARKEFQPFDVVHTGSRFKRIRDIEKSELIRMLEQAVKSK